MNNKTNTLEELFKLCCFQIPQYQRAYAWEESQLQAFVADLRQQAETQKAVKETSEDQESLPDKSYFLGTLLLHDVGESIVHVVDGQQRLTTSVIFIAAALNRFSSAEIFPGNKIKPNLLKRNFIFDEDEELQKFETIQEDNPFFKARVLNLSDTNVTEDSPSSKKLSYAFDYFNKHIKDDEWEGLVHTLIKAKVMVYSVTSSADATLIFELQNDRGKKLTDLEALKSYLMHLVYLHAKNPDQSLREIQSQFSHIYRTVEALSAVPKSPEEDSILSYHSVGYLKWKKDQWRRPKDLIKSVIAQTDKDDVVQWVIDFVSSLKETFKIVHVLLTQLDNWPELADIIILDTVASFWPLLIVTFNEDHSKDKKDFRLALRLMEVFSMRGYGLANLRSDAGLPQLYPFAKNFSGDFVSLHDFLFWLSYNWQITDRFKTALEGQYLFSNHKKEARYLLWRYENHLRSQKGQAAEYISWRHYLFPRDKKSSLNLEHIAAQNNPISMTEVKWEESDEPTEFHQVATHRLGNLVIDSTSANSSKGKYDFTDKLKHLSHHSTFLSQGELIHWAHEGTDGVFVWDVESVKRRQEVLVEFALDTWNPEKYHRPATTENTIQESEEDLD